MIKRFFIEIKNRIFLLALLWFFTFSACYIYKEILLFFFINYSNNFNSSLFYFIFTNVTELFYIYFFILNFISFQIACWYLIYHIIVFLNPALFIKEFVYFNFFFKLFTFFLCVSIFLSNYKLIPLTWEFFLNFKSYYFYNAIHFEAKLNEYLNFYIYIYFFCVVYSQIFAFLLFLQNVFFGTKIQRFRKIYYYIFIIVSAIITPPELVTQILLSLNLIFIYELILFFFLYFISLTNIL